MSKPTEIHVAVIRDGSNVELIEIEDQDGSGIGGLEEYDIGDGVSHIVIRRDNFADPVTDRIISVHLHNGFQAVVSGNEQTIDVLKQLLIPNRDVKAILIYSGESNPVMRSRLETLNYTELKRLREEAKS